MNTTATTHVDYESKAASYFAEQRLEMLPFIPLSCSRLLEVGCGAGTFGERLKRTRKIEVWGVEPVSSAAEKAKSKLDHVVNGLFDPQSGLPEGAFDSIVFNDVLEHMIAPEQALRYAKVLLSPGGAVIASIPNVRHLVLFWELMVRGRWEYRDCGLWDRTHLRFFTRSSIIKMFEDEGYAIERITGINPYVGAPNPSRSLCMAYAIVNALFIGKLADMKFQQFAVIARPSSERSSL